MIAPSDEVIEEVTRWLKQNGVQEYTLLPSRDFIRAKVPLSLAENLLECKFRYFEHSTSGTRIIRTLQYSVPSEISKHLDFVGGTVRFPTIRSAKKKLVRNPQLLSVTPHSIKDRYNITGVGKSSKNLQAVSQFLEQYYSPSDLQKFFQDFSLPDAKVQKVIGPNDPNHPGDEASLDIEYIMGVATNVPTWFIYTAGNDNGNQEPFLEWIVNYASMTTVPWVNSVSYGDDEPTISGAYMSRVDVQFQALGVRGVSILFASGDSGVGCSRCTKFIPNWPASSPYVTAVGGTQLRGQNEVGVQFSGGGFSNYFAQPSYQKSAVETYLSKAKLPPSHFWNKTSRAYPDISAFATFFEIVIDGSRTAVDGTSCSAPTAAGIFSLLNDLRLQNGKPALGFLVFFFLFFSFFFFSFLLFLFFLTPT
jgi:tripeptidyl-peptidase-1